MAKVKEIVSYMERVFKERNIPDARLSAELLLCHALGIDRLKLYMEPDRDLGRKEMDKIMELFERRLKREPVFYILGEREFFSRPFFVEKGVLIPRQETETLVEVFLKDVEGSFTALDFGAGSGVIGITIALERPDSFIFLVDKSRSSMRVSRKNIKRHGVKNTFFILADTLHPFKTETIDYIVSNPPYVKTGDLEHLQDEIKLYEPMDALDGGEDGLDFYRKIAKEGYFVLKKGGGIYLEIGYGMMAEVLRIFKDYEFIKSVKDLSGIERVLVFRKG